jgi:dTDP-4-dehydrorhamnose 3,5-epimerase
MDVISLDIDAVKLIRPRRFADARGFFVETWNRKTFATHGIDTDFVQDNYSRSHAAATVRGLHYQKPPAAQVKLVRVLAGSVVDVAVDMRKTSPTFGRHVAVTLTAEGGEQLYVPVGFAHGFCTLEPNTEVAYKVSAFYSPENDAGIVWNDPELGIAWPIGGKEPVLSEKDARLPRLADAASPF